MLIPPHLGKVFLAIGVTRVDRGFKDADLVAVRGEGEGFSEARGFSFSFSFSGCGVSGLGSALVSSKGGEEGGAVEFGRVFYDFSYFFPYSFELRSLPSLLYLAIVASLGVNLVVIFDIAYLNILSIA